MGEEANPADARNRGDASPGLKGTEEPFWAGGGGGRGRAVKVKTQPGLEIRKTRDRIQALSFAGYICVAPYTQARDFVNLTSLIC